MGQPQQLQSPNQYHLHGRRHQRLLLPERNRAADPAGPDPVHLPRCRSGADLPRRRAGGGRARRRQHRQRDHRPDHRHVQTIDIGSTSFSLVVPLVVLPADSTGPIPIETKGITTVHRIFVGAIGHAQRATYTV